MNEQRVPEPLTECSITKKRFFMASLKESVGEDGHKGRQSNCAVEQVAEGQVKEEQGSHVRHPGELTRGARGRA